MSSCKLWRDKQQLGHRCDTARVTTCKTPTFLRLDSTGEDTPSKGSCEQTKDMGKGRNKCCFTCKPRNLSFQSMVNGLNMTSVMNTASSYLTTATSYIESIYPHKTRSCLVNSRTTDNSMALDNLIENNCVMTAAVRTGNERPWPQVGQDLKKTWTDEILGALQSTVFYKDNSENMNRKADRYVPPHLKNRHCRAVFKDPKLTPYNAKLLEKSKRNSALLKNDIACHKIDTAKDRTVPHMNGMENINTHHADTDKLPKCEAEEPIKPEVRTSNTSENVTCKSDSKLKKECAEPKEKNAPDWFEYESDTGNIIPVNIGEIHLEQTKYKSDSVKTDEEPKSERQDKMLHSWFSMENDNEPKDSSCVLTIQNLSESSHKMCNRTKKPQSDSGLYGSIILSKGVEGKNGLRESKHERKTDNDTKSCNTQKKHSEDENEKRSQLISVLYMRNYAGQKRRPSAQKRSRHRAQKNTNCLKTIKANIVHPNSSSVAFILNLDNEPSFQSSCDIDELDWSSSEESGDDDVDASADIDFLPHIGSLLNFQVVCSGSIPSSQSTSDESSLIDRINKEWKENISREPEKPLQKKNSFKKVHFENDQKIATVHRMVTWAYAYQAARKGPWEEIARDRGRFQRRITEGEMLLDSILKRDHRDRIFEQRFKDCD